MKYILIALLMKISISLQASPSCSKNGTKVFYTNGIFTSRELAENTLRRITMLNLNSQIDQNPLRVNLGLAYNYTESVSKDLVEAAVQRFPTRFLREYGLRDGYAANQLYRNGKMTAPAYSNELNSISETILNTKDRIYTDIKINTNFSGQSYRLPKESRSNLCSFDVDSF